MRKKMLLKPENSHASSSLVTDRTTWSKGNGKISDKDRGRDNNYSLMQFHNEVNCLMR
jgi:hypothetical protein